MTVDADWAGDPKTGCSTSGGVLATGLCFTVRDWSVTQATVSLSSAESEAKAVKRLRRSIVRETFAGTPECETDQNRSLAGQ